MKRIWCWLKATLWDNPFQPFLLITLIIINLLGSLYGYYWYHRQLVATPVYWWLFVPDSPFSTTLFGLALLATLTGHQCRWFVLLAATASIKYGIWAMILISDYWLAGAPVAIIEFLLWISHLGMAIEGLLYLRHWPGTLRQIAGVLTWMALNDFLDYGLGLHPYLFKSDQFWLALVTAVSLTFILGLLLLISLIKKRYQAGKKKKRKNIIR